MEPTPGDSAPGNSETTRLVSARERGGAGGGLRLKSLFTEPSQPQPEEPKPVEMAFHHCHRDPLPQPGLTPERLQARRQLYAACAVCFVFMAGEVVGGYLAHSLAIMTDAAHLLADVGSMMGSLFSLWLSTRPATRTMTFGWHRSEWPLCCTRLVPPTATGLGGQSMHRWRKGLGTPCPWGTPASGQPLCMCWGTSCRALGYWLHPSSSTSRSCVSGPPHPPLRGPWSPGLEGLSLQPQYKVADPISTFLFSICALGSTAPTLRDVLRILMEGTPRSVGFEPVRDTLLSVPGVRATHELHLWALTLTYHVASAHLAIDSTADPEAVLAEASSRLYSRFGFSSCTLQVEQYQPEMAQCLRCREPPQA
ncbi:PREDICTED: zinc transporter 3 isoform X3 [Chinchilla lanigera]|uniref:zinc transporter 3 isoform X3 n=1 Tax=Chinchilla lanigera TaxID=34839 RepID=UPI0006990C0C|nr:PREDICTED: zinc transporter 3 isoform X3 [Chinchilla lanigera]